MKKFISSIFVACLGGLVALTSARYFYSSDKNNFNQITNPFHEQKIKLVGYPGNNNSEINTDFTYSAQKSVNAVVHIKTISEHVNNLNYDPFAEWFFGPQKRQQNYSQEGSGSGVIISDDGYIVTNNHVVNGADKIEVILNDKRIYEGELIGADASTDVALIKIKEKNLPFLNYGNSESVKIGEWVLAIGNPFNLESTVTAGIISAKGRSNILDGNKRPIESFIQTDAAVNPGNSGGALVNTNGDLIGINTAIASNNGAYQGYSFAIPVNIVKKIVSDLAEFGIVQRAYIGVSINDIDAKFAADKNINNLKGIYVNGVTIGGAAEDAGIKEGDVITKIENNTVGSVSELQEQLSKYRPGDKINLIALRNNKALNLTVTLKSLENTTSLVKKSEIVKKSMSALGAVFEEISNDDLNKLKLNNGVKIKRLNPGKLAQIGIKEGFIITSIDKKKVNTINDISDLLENKTGNVLIEGFYPNGARAYYGFSL